MFSIITMSKSYRHTPIIGNAANVSEKKDKRIGNRRLRRKAKMLTKKQDSETIYPIIGEVCNKWSMAKDGKHYLRKGSKYYKRCMRK